MRTGMWGVALAVLAGSAFAGEQAFDGTQHRAGEQKTAFARPAFPFEGEVTVERLNVRIFPKADATGVIASVIGLGEKVTVVGEKDEFYQILPTRGCTAWIFGRNVRREGDGGVVTAPEAAVRTDSRVNAEILCTLKEGDPVKILGEHMGWFKIEAPPAVKCFVARKYIRAGKALETAARDEKPAAPAPAAPKDPGRLASIHALLAAQRQLIDAGRLEEVDFGAAFEACEQAMAAANDPGEKAEVERLYRGCRDLHTAWLAIKARKAELDAQEEAIRRASQPKKPEKKEWAMTGYVDTTGSTLFKRPGTHKLVMGGKIMAFLRVKEGDTAMANRLNDLYERYVGVNGVVLKDPEGWPGYSVIVVDEIVPLMK